MIDKGSPVRRKSKDGRNRKSPSKSAQKRKSVTEKEEGKKQRKSSENKVNGTRLKGARKVLIQGLSEAETVSKSQQGINNEVTAIQFEEEGNVVEMETEGQATEFLSDEETLRGEPAGSDSEDEEEDGEIVYEEVFIKNRNAKATQALDKSEIEEQGNKNGGERKKQMNRAGHKLQLQPELTEEEKEERLINKTVAKLQQIMMQNGLLATAPQQQQQIRMQDAEPRPMTRKTGKSTFKGKNRGDGEKNETTNITVINSPSESTIYQTAVQPSHNRDRNSSSSEEAINTSDENLSGDYSQDLIENFISDCRVNDEDRRRSERKQHEQPQPSTSGYRPGNNPARENTSDRREVRPLPPPPQTADERADQIVRRAEASYKNNYRSEGIRVANARTKVIIFCKSRLVNWN